MKNNSSSYYVWEGDWDVPYAEDILIPEVWNEISLYRGSKVSKKVIPLQFYVNSINKLPDSLPNQWGYLVINAKLRKIIEGLNINVQYLDAVISEQTSNKISTDYKVLNILDVFDAIDHDQSKYEYFNEVIAAVDLLVLKDNIHEAPDLFRLKGLQVIAITSEKLMNTLNENKVTGIKFLPVGQFKM